MSERPRHPRRAPKSTSITKLHEDGEGIYLAKGNESDLRSKNHDPAAHRLGCRIETDGGGGGKLSFYAVRDDGGEEEIGVLTIRQAEYPGVRGVPSNYTAEAVLMLRNDFLTGTADARMVKMALLTPFGLQINRVLVEALTFFDETPVDPGGPVDPTAPPDPNAPHDPYDYAHPSHEYTGTLDFEDITREYGFPSDDEAKYHSDQIPDLTVVNNMNRRADRPLVD